MYYFIINPNSRSGKGALIWRDLENILRERNIKYQTFFTEYKGHAVKLSASITASIPEDSQIKLIAVGGDGTGSPERSKRYFPCHFRLHSHRIRKRFLPQYETSTGSYEGTRTDSFR